MLFLDMYMCVMSNHDKNYLSHLRNLVFVSDEDIQNPFFKCFCERIFTN